MLKRAVRVAIFWPFFFVASLGMVLLMPLFIAADWALSDGPYDPRTTLRLGADVMADSFRDVWTGEM